MNDRQVAEDVMKRYDIPTDKKMSPPDSQDELLSRLRKMLRTGRSPYNQKVEFFKHDELESVLKEQEQDPEKILEEWDKIRRRLRSDHADYHASCLLYALTWLGKAFLHINRDSRVESVSLPGWVDPGFSVYINRFRPIGLEIASDLTQTNATLEVQPRSSSYDDQDAARMATKLVRFWEASTNLNNLKSAIGLWLAIAGACYVHVTWDDTEFATVVDDDGEKSYEQAGNVRFDLVTPEKLMVPPSAECFDDADHVVYERNRSRGWLKRHYPSLEPTVPKDPDEHERQDHRAQWRQMLWNREDSTSLQPDFSLGKNNDGGEVDCPFLVAECYKRMRDPEHGEFWHRTVICRGVILEHEPFGPRGENGELIKVNGRLKMWPLPFVRFRYYPLPGSFHGQGVAKDALGVIRHLHKLDALAMKRAADSAAIILAQEAGAPTTETVERGVTRLKYHQRPPQYIVPPSDSLQLEKRIEYYEMQLDKVTNRPAALRGEAGSEDSGAKLRTIAQHAQDASSLIRQEYVYSLADVYRLALVISQDMMSQRRLIVIDENDASGAVAISGADFLGHTDVVSHLDVFWGTTRYERFQRALQLYSVQLIDEAQARRAISAGSREDLRDMDELQIGSARMMLNSIQKDMDEEDAAQFVQFIHYYLNTVMEEIMAGQEDEQRVDVMAARNTMAEAMNNMLMQIGIGAEEHFDLGVHVDEFTRFMLGNDYRMLGPGKKALVKIVRRNFAEQAILPSLKKQAAEQQAHVARRDMVTAMPQEQASRIPQQDTTM